MAIQTPVRQRTIPNKLLPALNEVAQLLEVHPSTLTRLVQRENVTLRPWGLREKRVGVVEIFQLALAAQRVSLEEVGGALMDWAEATHPEDAPQFEEAIDTYFAALPPAEPYEPAQLIENVRQTTAGGSRAQPNTK